jgi:hypothetical protein
MRPILHLPEPVTLAASHHDALAFDTADDALRSLVELFGPLDLINATCRVLERQPFQLARSQWSQKTAQGET